MPLDRLRHLLQTWAFCLVVASLQAYLLPAQRYETALVYSLAIGSCTWALIDFGRLWLDPASDTGWPRGWRGPALVAVALPLGFLAGMTLGDGWFGGSSWRSRSAEELLRSLAISTVAGTVISYYFYSRGRSSSLQRHARAARQEAAEARLKLLEAQLEPHMLFNTLANLRALVATDPPRAEAMLDHFIAYLRATLEGARAAWHPLSEEFARLEDYLALMAVRMGPRLSYRLALAPALASVPVPPLLLQPLVENAIRHGLEPCVEGGSIAVTACHGGDRVVLRIVDSGCGLAAGAQPGFGTRQLRERLASAWGGAASLHCEPHDPRGLRVELRFPLGPGA